MSVVGYARVSTLDQDLHTQLEALKAAGAEKVFSEKASGAKGSDRPELRDLLDWIREGDILIVTRLDRLGRSMLDLCSILQAVQDKGCAFRCLNQSIDTTTAEGRLMFGMLAAFAEFERHMIKERQAVGIANAKAQGRYKGGTKKVPVEEIHSLLKAGWGPSAIAKKLKVDRSTIRRNTPDDLKNPQPPQLAAPQEARRAQRHAELRP